MRNENGPKKFFLGDRKLHHQDCGDGVTGVQTAKLIQIVCFKM